MGLKERREREKEQRKSQILDAARDLLLREGIGATTVNSIARLAELSVGAIYSYFKSKEEIFAELQGEGLEIMLDMIKKGAALKGPVEERILSVAQQYRLFSEENKNYYDIINYFLSSPEIVFPADLKSKIDLQGERVLEQVENTIQDGVDSGELQQCDSREKAIMLWGLIHGILQFRKLKNTILKDSDFTSLYDNAVKNFINGLRC